MFKIGDKVIIKAEYRAAAESAHVYEVLTDANAMDRVQIAPVEWAWKIRPIELVGAWKAGQKRRRRRWKMCGG